MSQVEVTKLNEYVVCGPSGSQIGVGKLCLYVVLAPGDDGSTAPRQGHVHTQIVYEVDRSNG